MPFCNTDLSKRLSSLLLSSRLLSSNSAHAVAYGNEGALALGLAGAVIMIVYPATLMNRPRVAVVRENDVNY